MTATKQPILYFTRWRQDFDITDGVIQTQPMGNTELGRKQYTV